MNAKKANNYQAAKTNSILTLIFLILCWVIGGIVITICGAKFAIEFVETL